MANASASPLLATVAAQLLNQSAASLADTGLATNTPTHNEGSVGGVGASNAALLGAFLNATTRVPVALTTAAPPASIYSLRLTLTVIHLFLVCVGLINLLVIAVILCKPYMRSITNVYMLSLCAADFLYLANLVLVAATQLNDKSWPFGNFMCTAYHGTETTGKYASVLFVVLLAVDRYCAMCKANWCSRYRNYRTAIVVSCVAWVLAVLAATPLYAFSEVVMLRYRFVDKVQKLCIAKWPSSESAKWYITFSSVLIFAVPLGVIVFCYYHILNKLREALKGSKRLRRTASSRAPYHKVTRLVLWVVVFHVICWSPFWLFNVLSSVFGLRIQTQFDRIVINFLHLLPYINCALNPVLYVAHAENFRTALKNIFRRGAPRSPTQIEDSRVFGNGTLKLPKGTRPFCRFSGMSHDRLLSNSVHQSNPNSEYHKDSCTVRFNRAIDFAPRSPGATSNGADAVDVASVTDKSLLMISAYARSASRALTTTALEKKASTSSVFPQDEYERPSPPPTATTVLSHTDSNAHANGNNSNDNYSYTFDDNDVVEGGGGFVRLQNGSSASASPGSLRRNQMACVGDSASEHCCRDASNSVPCLANAEDTFI